MRPLIPAEYVIYTDGCPGGYGAVIRRVSKGKNFFRVIELSGSIPDTTSQQAELWAAIYALRRIAEDSRVTLYSDSQYLVNGMRNWRFKWVKRDWISVRTGEAVKNKDLWLQLIELVNLQRKVEFLWVRGHDGNVDNERADKLATKGRDHAKEE